MKIVWISSWFGDYRVPVYDNLNKLSEQNFYIICSEQETSDLVRRKLHDKLGEHSIILSNQKIFRIGNTSCDFANSTLELRWQRGLYSSLRRLKPDVIIVEGFGRWAPAGILYSLLHRKNLLMFYERTAWTERKAHWWRILYRKIMGKAVDCFLTNGILSEQYLRNNLGFTETPIVKGCMSADSFSLHDSLGKEYKNGDIVGKTTAKKGNKGLKYLFIGRIVEPKGILQLLEAWDKHHLSYPDDSLIVVGKGTLLNALQQKYHGRNGVEMTGYVSYDRIHEYYNMCDIVVMPTLEDNWSLVIPEAMSCGKAVMCSIYNGGHPELVKDKVNGFCFDPLDRQAFVETLAKFHHADLKEMGLQGIIIERHFSPQKSSQRIFNACKKANENRLRQQT